MVEITLFSKSGENVRTVELTSRSDTIIYNDIIYCRNGPRCFTEIENQSRDQLLPTPITIFSTGKKRAVFSNPVLGMGFQDEVTSKRGGHSAKPKIAKAESKMEDDRYLVRVDFSGPFGRPMSAYSGDMLASECAMTAARFKTGSQITVEVTDVRLVRVKPEREALSVNQGPWNPDKAEGSLK